MRSRFLLAAAILAMPTSHALAQSINVLAIGQSNMQGRFGPATYTDADPNIRVWNFNTEKWQTAKLGVSPFFVSRGEKTPANNLAYVFARELSDKCSLKVNLTILAAFGKRIEYFLPIDVLARHGWKNTERSGVFGDSLADEIFSPRGTASKALRALNAWRYDAVLIHQGEANFDSAGDDANTYAQKLGALLTELTRRGLTNHDTPTLIGTIDWRYAKSKQDAKAISSLASGHIGAVNWSGIETYPETTGTGMRWHATGNGLQELGDRYFDAYWNLIGKTCPGHPVMADNQSSEN